MKVYTSITEEQKSQLCVALGFFDGIHKGHRKVISETVKLKRLGLTPAVFTFEESPKSIIFKVKEKQITDNKAKKEKIESLGIEILYMIDFKKIMNFTRSEEKRQSHINNVESQLEELEQEVSSRKSRGFINLYLFSITIGIILILSIIYILVS